MIRTQLLQAASVESWMAQSSFQRDRQAEREHSLITTTVPTTAMTIRLKESSL